MPVQKFFLSFLSASTRTCYKAFTKNILKTRSKHLHNLKTVFQQTSFLFHKSPLINFYNFLKSKNRTKIQKSRGFCPLKIEPMEFRSRPKNVWDIIHPRISGINARPVIFFPKPYAFKNFRMKWSLASDRGWTQKRFLHHP